MAHVDSVDSLACMVIDDELEIANVVARQLKGAGYSVVSFNDPLLARDAFLDQELALIVSDNLMPEMTGLALLGHAKAVIPATRRILLTGYADEGQAIKAFNDDVIHRFMSKPWDRASLLVLVEEEYARYVGARNDARSRFSLEYELQSRNIQLRAAIGMAHFASRPQPEQEAPEAIEQRAATVLVADVVGYSLLMNDDAVHTVRTLQEWQMLIFQEVAQHEGRVVNAPGDSILIEFPQATPAVAFAQALQTELHRRNAALKFERRMAFRIGLSQGEILVMHGQLYGDSVNVAARLQTLAPPGGICISSSVRDSLDPERRDAFLSIGTKQLRNINTPVDVYAWKPPLLDA